MRKGKFARVKLKLAIKTIPFHQTASSESVLVWKETTAHDLRIIYGNDSPEVTLFTDIYFSPGCYYEGEPEDEMKIREREAFRKGCVEARVMLTAWLEALNVWDEKKVIKATWATLIAFIGVPLLPKIWWLIQLLRSFFAKYFFAS